jgi:crotonobetainyl-CoA:carnitine CoA-transferase CaiB-like acyl-CoA transferase
MCDPIAGVYGAIAALVALAERASTGRGQLVESPMVGGGLHVAAEQLVEFSATGELQTSMGNRSPLREQDVFRCRGDDAWVAISLPNGQAKQRLTELTSTSEFGELGEWCAARDAQQIVELLWPEGIAVSRVQWAHELLDNPQLAHREFFESVDSPLRGTHPHISWPAKFGAGPHRWNRTAAPTFGEHNDEVLAELGYSAQEVEHLRATEVISDGVLTTQKRW